MRKGIPGRTWLNGVSEVMGTERFHILSSQGPPLRPMPARGSGHREQGAELKPGIWVRVLALPLTCLLNLRLSSPALLVLFLLLSFAASSPLPHPTWEPKTHPGTVSLAPSSFGDTGAKRVECCLGGQHAGRREGADTWRVRGTKQRQGGRRSPGPIMNHFWNMWSLSQGDVKKKWLRFQRETLRHGRGLREGELAL